MEDLNYFNLMSSLFFDIEEEEPGEAAEEEASEEEAPGEEAPEEEAPGEEAPEEEAPGEEAPEEEAPEEEPGEAPEEEAADVNYITTVSENNISQIDLNKNTIDVFLIAAVLGSVLGFIFLQRIKSI